MNVPATQTIQLPAHLAQFQSARLSETIAGNIVSAASPYISIQGNKFTLVDGAGNEQAVGAYDPQVGIYLDCAIFDVAGHLSKVYYAEKFDPNAQTYQPPACWSDNGRAASKHAANPQNAPTFACGTCPHAEWGSATSAISGKGIKACHDQQKVAVLVPGFPAPFLLRIPPNSLKNFGAYGAQFKGQQFDMDMMMTRLSFEQQGVGTLLFNAVGWIDTATAGLVQQIRQVQGADILLGRNDVPREPMAALPAPVAYAPQPTTQQVPQSPLAAPVVAPQVASPAMPVFPSPSTASPQPATPTPLPVGTATTASPSEAPQQRRRRGRPATDQPAPAAAPQAPFPHLGVPNTIGTPTTFQPAPAPAQPASFGMATPAPSDPGLMNTLQNVFGTQQK